MSNIQTLAEEELTLFIRSFYGDDYCFITADQGERIDWRVEIAKYERGEPSAITPPWGVFHLFSAEPLSGWGMNASTFGQRAQAWHTERIMAEDGTARDVLEISALLAQKAHDLRKALYAHQFTYLTVLDEGTRVNTSLDTAPNRYFSQAALPYKSGCLDIQFMYGEVDAEG